MTSGPKRKPLLERGVDFFKLPRRGKHKPTDETESLLPPPRRVVAMKKRVKRAMSSPFRSLGNKAVGSVTDKLIDRVVNERSADLDRAATQAIQRTIAIIAIGLWGAVMMAAISLALSVAIGGQPKEWLAYVLIVSGGLSVWNVATFVYYIRAFRRLEGNMQRRLLILVASKIGVKGLIIFAMPVVVLIVLGIARFLLP